MSGAEARAGRGQVAHERARDLRARPRGDDAQARAAGPALAPDAVVPDLQGHRRGEVRRALAAEIYRARGRPRARGAAARGGTSWRACTRTWPRTSRPRARRRSGAWSPVGRPAVAIQRVDYGSAATQPRRGIVQLIWGRCARLRAAARSVAPPASAAEVLVILGGLPQGRPLRPSRSRSTRCGPSRTRRGTGRSTSGPLRNPLARLVDLLVIKQGERSRTRRAGSCRRPATARPRAAQGQDGAAARSSPPRGHAPEHAALPLR